MGKERLALIGAKASAGTDQPTEKALLLLKGTRPETVKALDAQLLVLVVFAITVG
jgi:hypothetical protein